MKFFHYRQNNSGGSFIFDKNAGLTCNVIIEAYDYEHANARARQIGLYFNGCDDGADCPCCGDRWYPQYSYDAGEEVPSIYGESIENYKPLFKTRWNKEGFEHAVHFADGTIKLYSAEGQELE